MTNLKYEMPVAEYILNQEFAADDLDQKWDKRHSASSYRQWLVSCSLHPRYMLPRCQLLGDGRELMTKELAMVE